MLRYNLAPKAGLTLSVRPINVNDMILENTIPPSLIGFAAAHQSGRECFHPYHRESITTEVPGHAPIKQLNDTRWASNSLGYVIFLRPNIHIFKKLPKYISPSA
jgi:hypothetical protein